MPNDVFSGYFGDEEQKPSGNDVYSSYFPEETQESDYADDPLAMSLIGNTPEQETSVKAGLLHGMQKAPSLIAQGGARAIDYIKGGNALTPVVDDYVNNQNALFDEKYGKSAQAQAGDFTGNLLATAPATAGIMKGGQLASQGIKAAGNKLMQIGLEGINNGVQGGLLGATNPLNSSDNVGDRTKEGAAWGFGLSTAIPAATVAGAKLADMTTGGIDPASAALAQHLYSQYGIKVPGYQLSSSPTVQKTGSILERLGLTNKDQSNDMAMQAISKAIGHPTGANGLTEDVMQQAKDANSAGYDNVLDQMKEIKVGNLDTKLSDILDRAQGTLDANQLQPLRHVANSVLNNVQKGDVIPAQVYKDMIKKGSILDKASQSPTIGPHAQEIEGALRDSMRASATSDQQDTLKNLDLRWKNMRTVEPLAAKSDAAGKFPLSLLTAPVNKSFSNRAYTGAGVLGDIAKGAKTFGLSPSSGTAENNFLLKLATGGGVGDVGLAMHDPIMAAKIAAGSAAALGVGRTVGSGLTSDWYRNALLKSALQGGSHLGPWLSGAEELNPLIQPTAAVGADNRLTR